MQPVNHLHFFDHICLHAFDTFDLQDVVGVDGTFCQFIACFNYISLHHLEPRPIGDGVALGLSTFAGHDDLPLLLGVTNRDSAGNFTDNRKALWLSGLKQLLYTGKTLCDIVSCNTACVEGTHGKLGTWFADGLCCNDAHCFANVDQLACGHVGAITFGTYAVFALTGEHRADVYFGNARIYDLSSHFASDELVCAANQFTCLWVMNIIHRDSASNSIL